MPTVLRILGLKVRIWTNDHGPPHVHVVGIEKEAKFWLNCPSGPVDLWLNFGFKIAELNDIKSKLNKSVPRLCREWKRIHDNRSRI